MKITEIYVDGFRNIKETTLEFVEPIIVLLAPNNYGKSNLLLAIQNGFDLISLQATHAVKYIKDSENYANWNIGKDHNSFTFGVKFTKVNTPDAVYHYQYSLGYRFNDDENTIEPTGVVSEFLSCEDKEEVRLIFKRKNAEERECKKDDVVELCNGAFLTIPGDKKSGKQNYLSSHYLALHKLGGMAIFDNSQNHDNGDSISDSTREIVKEIASVLTSLTRESIGDIIADERSDFFTPSELSLNAEIMKKRDDENEIRHRKDNRVKKTRIFDYFKGKFKTLFKDYIIGLDELGDSGQYKLFFDLYCEERKIRSEKPRFISFGTRRVFKLLSQIIANATPLISLEEIEIGLHPELYRDLVRALFSVLNNDLYLEETGDERLHEPRLIISSHAPGVINALGQHLDSIYVAVPNMDESSVGVAQFAKLSEDGKKELKDDKYLNFFGAGDIIFGLSSAKSLRGEVMKLLDVSNKEMCKVVE